ncbi:hypothetical protein STEG23_032283 [Scotinomys teguina]
MEMKAAAQRCQLLLILLMSVVMLLPGTNGSLLLVQRTVTRTIVSQETIGKGDTFRLKLEQLPITEFDLQSRHDGRKEPIPSSCPLTSKCEYVPP